MIDWLQSKLAIIVASMILLGFFIAIFAVVNESMKDNQAQIVANRIAETIGGVGRFEGETRILVHVGPEREGGSIPSTILGEAYSLIVYNSSVSIFHEGSTSRFWKSARLHTTVYLFKPSKGEYRDEEFNSLERSTAEKGLKIRPLADFYIEKKLVKISGIASHKVFIYPC